MSEIKRHVPAPGYAVGLAGTALCGRRASYHTGDHAAIRRSAVAAIRAGDAAHYCAPCAQRLGAAVVAEVSARVARD
jgi:hypothetical protein